MLGVHIIVKVFKYINLRTIYKYVTPFYTRAYNNNWYKDKKKIGRVKLSKVLVKVFF